MRVAMRFPVKITSSCIWVAIPVELFYIGMPVVRTGGRCTVVKFSRMGSYCARFMHESSAISQLLVKFSKFNQKHIIIAQSNFVQRIICF